MYWLIRRAAVSSGRDLRIPKLYWNEERNTWLWTIRKFHCKYIATKHGDVMECISWMKPLADASADDKSNFGTM